MQLFSIISSLCAVFLLNMDNLDTCLQHVWMICPNKNGMGKRAPPSLKPKTCESHIQISQTTPYLGLNSYRKFRRCERGRATVWKFHINIPLTWYRHHLNHVDIGIKIPSASLQNYKTISQKHHISTSETQWFHGHFQWNHTKPRVAWSPKRRMEGSRFTSILEVAGACVEDRAGISS